MKKTNTTLARELAEAYAANLPHDEIREELETRGCPRLAIDAAFADNLAPSAVGTMDERQLDAALAAAARDMVEAMKRRAAAASLGRKGGRSRSAAKVAAVRANGAKGGRPPRAAGDSHVWTFAEVAAAFGDRSFVSPAGRGLFVRAACCPGEDSTVPAFFDVAPNWSDHIGPHDDCDRSVDDLVRKISAKFPSPEGWTYRPSNGTIDQVATFSMPGWAPVAGL